MPRRKTETNETAASTEVEYEMVHCLQVGPLSGSCEGVLMPGVGHEVDLPIIAVDDLVDKGIVEVIFED